MCSADAILLQESQAVNRNRDLTGRAKRGFTKIVDLRMRENLPFERETVCTIQHAIRVEIGRVSMDLEHGVLMMRLVLPRF